MKTTKNSSLRVNLTRFDAHRKKHTKKYFTDFFFVLLKASIQLKEKMGAKSRGVIECVISHLRFTMIFTQI